MRVYLDMVGCRLNQSELERYARQFVAAGHLLVSSPHEADLVVLNTCTVTTAAASDSRQKIRQVARAGSAQIVVTGCWSTRNTPEALSLPGVSQVIPNLQKDRLVADLLHISRDDFDLEPTARRPVPGARRRTRAFIKVQDGCDNHCAFCITALARGPSRSQPLNVILADIDAARQETNVTAQEIVLTGVHLGSWGQDFTLRQHLYELVQGDLDHTDAPRVRLSSIEPWDLDPDFFTLWQNSRLCRQLHLPLQSGCAATLQRMARKTNPEAYADLLAVARESIPGVAITTDLIVGYPGESEAEFKESLAFVQKMQFADGHVFTFSARPGTAAARLPNQVPHALKKERSIEMRSALKSASDTFRQRCVGDTVSVLWEGAKPQDATGWSLSGHSDNYLHVTAVAPVSLWNHISTVRLADRDDEGMRGVIILENQ